MKKIGDGTRISAPDHNSADSQDSFANYVEVESNAIGDVLEMPPIKPFSKNAEEYEARMVDVFNDVIDYSQNPCELPPRELNIKNFFDLSLNSFKYFGQYGNDLLVARLLAPSFLKGDRRVCPSVRSIVIGQQYDQEVEKRIKKEKEDYDNTSSVMQIFRKNPYKQTYYRPYFGSESKRNNTDYTSYVGQRSLDITVFEEFLRKGIIEIVDDNGNIIPDLKKRLWEKLPMYVRFTKEGFEMLKEQGVFRNRNYFDID